MTVILLEPASLAPVVARDHPAAHFVACDAAGRHCATASSWAGDGTLPDGRVPGVIGHFSACDQVSAYAVLNAACKALRALGRTIVVGPMDGNTWGRYRLVTDAGTRPPFFLEPENPPAYPQYFLASGFKPIATYHSTLFDLTSPSDPRTDAAVERFARDGITFRPLHLTRLRDDLNAVHLLSVTAFASNYLYSPLPVERFIQQYQTLGPSLRPEFTLLAEQAGELVGFVFAIPNLLEPEPHRTLVVKTVAVRPGRRTAGLGTVLIDLVRRRARELGFIEAIHALMHDDNASRRIGSGVAKPLRRYTLYALELG